MSELTEFRKAKDKYFQSGPGSPLTPEQKKEFAGLKYYTENAALRIVQGVARGSLVQFDRGANIGQQVHPRRSRRHVLREG